MNSQLVKDLECPITLELLEDPVNTPCCARAFSRHALLQLSQPRHCPMCHADLVQFDVKNAPKNVNLAGMIDSLRALECKQRHHWDAVVTRIATPNKTLNVAEVKLSLADAAFERKPCLVLAVVDKSGSMAGKAWSQVQVALAHLVGMTWRKPNTVAKIVVYDSFATLLDTENRDVPSVLDMIKRVQAGGGTNFLDAFAKMEDVLNSGVYGSAVVVFMTDGQGTANVEILRKSVAKQSMPITIHTVGFGAGCDRALLEQIRKAGNLEGVFRFAEPSGEDEDTLCEKLSSCFSFACSSSAVADVRITLHNAHTLDACSAIRFTLGLNAKNSGTHTFFVCLPTDSMRLTIRSAVDEDVVVDPAYAPTMYNAPRFQAWLSAQIDVLAAQTLAMNEKPVAGLAFRLQQCLLCKKLDLLGLHTPDSRVSFLRQQLQRMLDGEQVNVGKLAEVRFDSKFQTKPQAAPALEHKLEKPRPEEMRIRYTTCYCLSDALRDGLVSLDEHANTALHLAACRGELEDVRQLLQAFPNTNVNASNGDQETPVTLAIKARGYYKTLELLMQYGGQVPADRLGPLKQFVQDHGYELTLRALLRAVGSNCVDATCSEQVILDAFDEKSDVQLFLRVGCAKQMIGFVKCLFEKHGAKADAQNFLEFCIPQKPDHPNVGVFVALMDLFLKRDPNLALHVNETDGETFLFKATERGNLPVVQMLLDHAPQLLDVPNKLGNSALWIACAKAFPCIIDELLARGADPNLANAKGNPPLYNTCQRGPLKVAQRLLQNKASPHFINNNGDTPVLLCARNGQVSILEELLKHVTLDMVNVVAHIDGFNALFASVEQNRPACIQALVTQHPDLNLEQHTDSTNAILPLATPLHLAAYYNRAAAAQKLLELKASTESVDKNNATPLHCAVVHGHQDVIRILIAAGANVHAKDDFQNSALAYAKSRPEICKLLQDPLLDVLMLVAKNHCNAGELQEALDVLDRDARVANFIEPQHLLEPKDHDNCTPLMQAVIYSNAKVCKLLVKLGCNPHAPNRFGISPCVFAHWIGNARVLECMPFYDAAHCTFLARLCGMSRMHQTIARPCGTPTRSTPESSAFATRTARSASVFVEGKSTESVASANPRIETSYFGLEKFSDANALVDFSHTNLVFNAQVHVTNMIASANNQSLSVVDLMCLTMFTNNAEITARLANGLPCRAVDEFSSALTSALSKLPNHCGEVFAATPDALDRTRLHIGQTIAFPNWLCASTLFNVALLAVPHLTTHKKGTVFLIQSKTGKFVAPFCQYTFDAEVLFAPNTRFQVVGLYHGDSTIVLAQANIRQHSFAIKPTEWQDMYATSQRSLVVELQEI